VATYQSLDVAGDKRLGVSQVRLRKHMTEESASLTVCTLIPHAEESRRGQTHRFIYWCLEELCLLSVDLLYTVDIAERDLFRANADGGSISLVKFVNSLRTIPCQVDKC